MGSQPGVANSAALCVCRVRPGFRWGGLGIASPAVLRTSGVMAGSGRSWEDNEERFRVWVTTRDRRVRDELLEANLPLVRPLALRFAHRGESLEDLVQVGAIGLIKAVD